MSDGLKKPKLWTNDKSHVMLDMLRQFDDAHLMSAYKWKEYVVSILVLLSCLAILIFSTVSVPAVWHYPLFLLFNISAIMGISDILFFCYWKVIMQGLTPWASVNASTMFHLAIYIMLMIVGNSLISI